MTDQSSPAVRSTAASSRLWVTLAIVGVALVAVSLFAFADGEAVPGAAILAVGVVFLIAAAVAHTARGRAALANLKDYQTSPDSGYVSPIGDSGGGSDGGGGGGD